MSRCKKHEQFIREMDLVNPRIKILSSYINDITKVNCSCRQCGHVWKARPTNLLQGIGCPQCAIKNGAMKKRKSQERFVLEISEKHPKIEIMGEYVTAGTKIKCKCTVCGNIWETRPNTLLKSKGCPECRKKLTTPKNKKTHDEFIIELIAKHPAIEVIGQYHNAKTKIQCHCQICDHTWKTTPNRLSNKSGCPNCARITGGLKRRKTQKVFLSQLKIVSPNILVIEEYKNSKSKVTCRCAICNHEWQAKPSHLLDGHGCPHCKAINTGKRCTKTHEQFLKDLAKINPSIEIMGEYKKANKKIKCRCKKDNHEWSATPNSLLKGQGCPKCSESKGERQVAEILDELRVAYTREHRFDNCKDKHRLSFDFFLPEYNCCIEYDGKQHFEPIAKFGGLKGLKSNQKRDKIKNLYCRANEIDLIRIPYTEENIEAFIMSRLLTESK